MKKFISFSGGVESTTMCILYGAGATAIWCDTGWEHKEMYQRMDTVEAAIKKIHPDFTLLRLKPSINAKGEEVTRLQDYIRRMKFMPTMMQRFCTRIFKIEPIDKFLKDQGECELLIGFNADEEPGSDRTGNFMECKNVIYRYPLYDEGYDRSECEKILHEYGLHPQFPIYMQRGGCEGCLFKKETEYKALYFFDRETFDRNRQLEEDIQHERKKFFSISMSMTSFAEIAAECEAEVNTWGEPAVKAMYQKIKPSQSCGAFCHR